MAQSTAFRTTRVQNQWATCWRQFSSSFFNHSSLPKALPASHHHHHHHPEREHVLLKGQPAFCAGYTSQSVASDIPPLASDLQTPNGSLNVSFRDSDQAPQEAAGAFERDGGSIGTETREEHESDSSGPPSTSGAPHKQTAPVDPVREAAVEAVAPKVGTKRLCYYWTQGKCDQASGLPFALIEHLNE